MPPALSSVLGCGPLADDLAAAAARLRASTVAVLVGGPRAAPTRALPDGYAGHGSGIVWRAGGLAGGLVVTNAHVARADRATLVLPDGREAPARLVARDPRRDLAVLRVDGRVAVGGLTPAAVGDPAALRPGQLVLALGHPLGHANALAVGVVHGAMSGVEAGTLGHRRRWESRAGAALVRADVRLLPGNSGGPLADAAGRVVGVNTMVVNGLGVAVAAHEAEALVAAVEGAARSGVRSAA